MTGFVCLVFWIQIRERECSLRHFVHFYFSGLFKVMVVRFIKLIKSLEFQRDISLGHREQNVRWIFKMKPGKFLRVWIKSSWKEFSQSYNPSPSLRLINVAAMRTSLQAQHRLGQWDGALHQICGILYVWDCCPKFSSRCRFHCTPFLNSITAFRKTGCEDLSALVCLWK